MVQKSPNEIKEIYEYDFPPLVEGVKDRWGYEIKDGDIRAIGSYIIGM